MMHVWIVWRDDVPDRTEAPAFAFSSQEEADSFIAGQADGFYLSRKVPLDPSLLDDVRVGDETFRAFSGMFGRLALKS